MNELILALNIIVLLSLIAIAALPIFKKKKREEWDRAASEEEWVQTSQYIPPAEMKVQIVIEHIFDNTRRQTVTYGVYESGKIKSKDSRYVMKDGENLKYIPQGFYEINASLNERYSINRISVFEKVVAWMPASRTPIEMRNKK